MHFLKILLYTNCILGLTEPDDGHRHDRNMLVNNIAHLRRVSQLLIWNF